MGSRSPGYAGSRTKALIEQHDANCCQQQEMADAGEEHLGDQDADTFYSLFGLETFSTMTPENRALIDERYRELAKKWHPDENSVEMKLRCELMMVNIQLAHNVLKDGDRKRRYDKELRRARGQKLDMGWYCRWGFTLVSGV